MGQILGVLIIFAIIYYPLIKPLTFLNRGDIVIKHSLNENIIEKLKYFSIIITIYHFLLSLFVFVIVIIKTYRISYELNNSFFTGYTFLWLSILGVIVICLFVTLYYLFTKKDNTENVLKLGFIIPIHCFIGIVCSFLIGDYFLNTLNQNILGILFFLLLLLEFIYLISIYRFHNKTGIIWEKNKTENANTKDS